MEKEKNNDDLGYNIGILLVIVILIIVLFAFWVPWLWYVVAVLTISSFSLVRFHGKKRYIILLSGVVLVFGYAGISTFVDRAPSIEISTEKEVVQKDTFMAVGKVSPGDSVVQVNDKEVEVSDGNFSREVPVYEGENNIVITAINKSSCKNNERLVGCKTAEQTINVIRELTEEEKQEKITEYHLDFSAEYVGDSSFTVEGTTDLPDESVLNIQIKDKEQLTGDSITNITGKATVKNGEFETTVSEKRVFAPMLSELYRVTVSFNSKNGQPETVLRKVGRDGEYLSGELVSETTSGGNIIKKEKVISKSSGQLSAWEQSRAGHICQKYPSWGKRTCQAVADGKVFVGMKKEQARASWGNPDDINKTTNAFGSSEQWVYGYSNFLYFEDDTLTTIQN